MGQETGISQDSDFLNRQNAMRFVALAAMAPLVLSSCSSTEKGPGVGVHIVKIEKHPWPPDVAKQINDECFKDNLHLAAVGDWRMMWVVLWSLDDSSLEPEVIQKFEDRVRELDRSK